jgi:serine/threonine protein kinase
MAPAPTDSQFGSYVLLHELGRGGQAVVWLAEDSRLKRRVALKILPALGPGSERVLARFRREAEVTSQLEHPVICPVYEADVHGGVPFLAMRFVEGETLARRIAEVQRHGGSTVVLRGDLKAPPDWNAIATFFAKIARALHVAHEVGVVHRDIKPANLMVTPDGEPVILDFGLARQDDPDSQLLSLSGEHSGTPAYMSPEQMSGRSRPDRRSDVYSLGCALFEALTGRPPFEAPTLEGLFHAILHVDATSASRVNAAVPEDLAVITTTATDKERERRYKTALDFALDLERFAAMEPIAARPVTTVHRIKRWTRRNPALAAALGGVLVLGLVATGMSSYAIGASGRADLEAALRKIADDDRARMLQEAADKDLARRLDEASMKFSTLVYGHRGGSSGVSSLVPGFLAVLRDAGIDLDAADATATATATITKLRARDEGLGRALLDTMRNLGAISTLAAQPRQRLLQILATFEDSQLKAISAAKSKWDAEQIDTFEPLLAEAELKKLTPDQLAELGAMLLGIPKRGEQWATLVDRAILRQPDSYPLHFMRGGLTLGVAAQDMRGPSAERLARTAVAHLQTAMALRPRSGLARCALAGAQAVLATATGDQGGYYIAWQTVESAVQVDPDNPLVWYFRADFLRRTPNGTKNAIAACRKALELDRTFTPAQELLDELSR